MTDLELLVAGAMVTFLATAGAYVSIRHRANDDPVRSYKHSEESIATSGTAESAVDAR